MAEPAAAEAPIDEEKVKPAEPAEEPAPAAPVPINKRKKKVDEPEPSTGPEDGLKAIHLKDPKIADLQKKKVEIKHAIEEETADKELTEEEEKAKFEKELKGLEREGKRVAAKTKLSGSEKALK